MMSMDQVAAPSAADLPGVATSMDWMTKEPVAAHAPALAASGAAAAILLGAEASVDSLTEPAAPRAVAAAAWDAAVSSLQEAGTGMDWVPEPLPEAAAASRQPDPWDSDMQPATQDLVILATPSVSSTSNSNKQRCRAGEGNEVTSGMPLAARDPMRGPASLALSRAHTQHYNVASERATSPRQDAGAPQGALQLAQGESSAVAQCNPAGCPSEGASPCLAKSSPAGGHLTQEGEGLPHFASRASGSQQTSQQASAHRQQQLQGDYQAPVLARPAGMACILPQQQQQQQAGSSASREHSHHPDSSSLLLSPEQPKQHPDSSTARLGGVPQAPGAPADIPMTEAGERNPHPGVDEPQALVGAWTSHADVTGFVWAVLRRLVPQVSHALSTSV